MRLLRGKIGGLVSFIGIAALVVGGLGWVTREALQMEEERRLNAAARECEKLQKEQDERWQALLQQIEADRNAKMRQALMLLDSRLAPALAREDSRPYPQFEALHSPFPAVNCAGTACDPGQVFVPSPLLTAKLPDWMLLHFQIDPVKGWSSPQVIPDSIGKMLQKQPISLTLNNVNEAHRKRLEELKAAYPLPTLLATLNGNGLRFETMKDKQQHEEQMLNEVNFPLNQSAAPNAALTISGANTYSGTTTTNAGVMITNTMGNDNAQDSNKRLQVATQSKYEGLGGFNNDGRQYATPAGPPVAEQPGYSTSKALEAKQKDLDALLAKKPVPPSKEDQKKIDAVKKEIDDLKKALQPIEIEVTSMQPLWLPSPEQPKHLLMLRSARVGDRPAFQGILLDWARLQEILKSTIDHLLPDAKFIPLAANNPDRLDREMFALPIELEAGPAPVPEAPEPIQAPPQTAPGWTPLRIGLAFAWSAALVALVAVGLGGWSLLDFSERRIRFVSAVTHELRTPLTTLRLYLDLLNSGLINDAKQREEYIKTLGGEADRLHRLIGNVLDFARLEKTRPSADRQPVVVADLLEQLRQTWQECCAASGKSLQISSLLPADAIVNTDRNLVEQIVGNLIDNARKYSQDAKDPLIALRALAEGNRLVIEVEDRGPGVAKRERGSIFRAFRRGGDADVKAGGVGLGLALATRWASLIGGRLSVKPSQGAIGACFRLEIPLNN